MVSQFSDEPHGSSSKKARKGHCALSHGGRMRSWGPAKVGAGSGASRRALLCCARASQPRPHPVPPRHITFVAPGLHERVLPPPGARHFLRSASHLHVRRRGHNPSRSLDVTTDWQASRALCHRHRDGRDHSLRALGVTMIAKKERRQRNSYLALFFDLAVHTPPVDVDFNRQYSHPETCPMSRRTSLEVMIICRMAG